VCSSFETASGAVRWYCPEPLNTKYTQPVKVAELVSDVPKCNGCCTRVPPHCFEVHMELIMRLWD